MRMIALFTAALAVGAGYAQADPLTINLPGAASAERSAVEYSCTGGHKVAVDYVNGDANSLAVISADGRTILMASVISGSGARYAGQQFVWWTKGDKADFYDLTKGEAAPPEFSCEAK